MSDDSSDLYSTAVLSNMSRGSLSPQCLLLNHSQVLEYLADDKDTIQVCSIQSCFTENVYRPKLCSCELGDSENFVTALDLHPRSPFFGFATSNGKLLVGGAFCKNDNFTPSISTRIVWEGQSEPILQLKHHPIDQGIVALQFEPQERDGKFFDPVKVLDLVQDDATLLQINSPEIVYDISWNFDSRSVLTVASEKCIRIVDIRCPKSYLAQFVPNIPYKLAYSQWRTSTLCCFSGKNLDFYDIRLLGTPFTSVPIEIDNPFDVISLKWHRYQPEQIFVETPSQFYRVTLKNSIQLCGYMRTPLNIAKPQECVSFLDLYNQRFSGPILEGRGEGFFNESNELTFLDYNQHFCLSLGDADITCPYIWTEPFEFGQKQESMVEISRLNQNEFHLEHAELVSKPPAEQKENFHLEELQKVFDSAVEKKRLDVFEWRQQMREAVESSLVAVGGQEHIVAPETGTVLQRHINQFTEYDFGRNGDSKNLCLEDVTAALLSEEGQMKLEYGIPKPLHLLTVGGGKAKKKDKELIIGEVFDDITDADGQEEKKLREEAILKEQKLKLELARANPRTRSQLARQFQMLSENTTKSKNSRLDQTRERRVLEYILQNFREAELLEMKAPTKYLKPTTVSFGSDLFKSDRLLLGLDFAFDTDAVVAYTSSCRNEQSQLDMIWDSASGTSNLDPILDRPISDIRMHEATKSTSKRMLHLIQQRIRQGWWTPKKNSRINHRAYCASLIAKDGLPALWKTWLKNTATMQYTTKIDYQGYEPPNIQRKRERRKEREETRKGKHREFVKWKKNVDGKMVRGGDRDEYMDVTEELAKQGESARNPQVIFTPASRVREKKRVRLKPDAGKEPEEEEKSRERSPVERHKYVRQRSFSEDNMTNQMQEKDSASKKKLKQRNKRQRSPRTPPAGIQLGQGRGLEVSLSWTRTASGDGLRSEKSSPAMLAQGSLTEESSDLRNTKTSDSGDESNASLDTIRSLVEDDEDGSEFVKSGFSKTNLLVDSSFRLIADDLSPSAAGQSLPSESVISISNAYSKQFYDMAGKKLPQRLNGQDEEMILDQQGGMIEQEKDRKKEKSHNYPRATPEQVAEVRNGPYGWVEEATTSEFESSPSDSEPTELKENLHGDYEYYYHTPNPRKIREKTRTKTRESTEGIRGDTDEGLPGMEEPETMEIMQQVMGRLGEGTEMEMAKHPDDVKRLFLTWLRKIQTQKQPKLCIESFFNGPVHFDLVERPSAWRNPVPIDEAIRKIGDSRFSLQQKLRALRSLRLGRAIPSYSFVTEQKNRSCILDAMWDCVFAALNNDDRIRKFPITDWPPSLIPNSAQHLSPQDPHKSAMKKSPSDEVEQSKPEVKQLTTIPSSSKVIGEKYQGRHPKSVEVANEVVATDSPPHFVHLFETRRPSEDSIHPVSAPPKSVTSRRGSNDAIDVKQMQTSEAQPIRQSTSSVANFSESDPKGSPDLSIGPISRKSTRAEVIQAIGSLQDRDASRIRSMLDRMGQIEDEIDGNGQGKEKMEEKQISVEEVKVQEVTAKDLFAYWNHIRFPVDDAEEPKETMTESEHEVIPEPVREEPKPEPKIVESHRQVHFDNKETDITEFFASFHVDEDGGRLNYPFQDNNDSRVKKLLQKELQQRPKPVYKELNEDMINVKGLPGLLQISELILQEAERGFDKQFGFRDHCELFESTKLFVSPLRNLILMSLGLPPIFLEFAATVEKTSSDGSDFEEDRLCPFESSDASTSSTEDDYDNECDKMIDEMDQMRTSILLEAGVIDPLPIDVNLDAKPDTPILRDPHIYDIQSLARRSRNVTGNQKQLLRRKSKLLLHKDPYKRKNLSRKELNREFCLTWLEQNKILKEDNKGQEPMNGHRQMRSATLMEMGEPVIKEYQYRISTKNINDVSQLCKGAFQSACYLDTPNVYIIQRQISDHLSNDFNANPANVEIYRRMNNAIEKILTLDYDELKAKKNELIAELSTVREVSATLGYKSCIALCSFFESVLKFASLNDIQNLSADFRILDAFDLAVEGMDRLVFVGLGYHPNCMQILANESRFSGDFMLVSQLLYIGRCAEKDTTILQTIRELEEELKKQNRRRGHMIEDQHDSDVKNAVQKLLTTYFADLSRIVECEENDKIPSLQDKFSKSYLENDDNLTPSQVSLQLRTDMNHLIRLLTALLHGPAIHALFHGFNEPENEKVPQLMEMTCNFCFQMYSQQGSKKGGSKSGGGTSRQRDDLAGSSSDAGAGIGMKKYDYARKERKHKDRDTDESGSEGADAADEDGNDTEDANVKFENRRRHVKGCPSCGQPLPRCFTCLRRFGYPLKSTDAKCPNFTICTLCNHGGHLEHVQDWFSRETFCAVAGCSCQCMQSVRRDVVPVVSPAESRKDQFHSSFIQG
ncbi:hypothetical protein WR25_10141 [Diploscapter pachys]|uniref:GATOR2 complex protein MIO zinc-ribbon like domain-containing protein n=1 Tax=Diploscapter pachys TaxID=2018661 RepID=A0A2A2LEV2_9BILA|nr:hypothetical protein WR25_10141 [Diploscapter pachys]